MISKRTYLFVFTVICALSVQSVLGKRGFSSHSYPKSSGHSGHGSQSHSYPTHTGLSGNRPSGSHAYPTHSGSSGSNHPPSHSYPTHTQQQQHSYPAGGSHGYPNSPGLSGNSHSPKGSTTHITNIHNNYHYSPPQQIRYTPQHGPAQSYPVYHGTPPTYVYQVKDSGSKYGTLLAGLALLNLGTLAGTAYIAHNVHSSSSSGHGSYQSRPGEICKFGLKKDNGDYEETRIDCQLISSFIYQEEAKNTNTNTNTQNITTTTVTNVTVVNTTVPEVSTTPPRVIYEMLPNGTFVPLNVTLNTTDSNNNNNPNATTNNSVTVTTTTTNTTVVNAVDVKGKPIDVTPGMQCFVIRNSPTSNMRKTVPCGLLQSYAVQSLKPNSGVRNVMSITLLSVVAARFLI